MALPGMAFIDYFAGFFDVFLLVTDGSVSGRITGPMQIASDENHSMVPFPLFVVAVRRRAWRGHWRRRERRVVVWPVSCGVAGGGAGYAAPARRAGSCCPAIARRPAPQGPAAPEVGKEPPAAPRVHGPSP